MLILYIILCTKVLGVTLGVPMFEDKTSQNQLFLETQKFVSRSQWNAREAKRSTLIGSPVPYVIIHHSYEPGPCHYTNECGKAMRSMQNYHMDDQNWNDIGYNFAVGSDGVVYEGRGWDVVGAHATSFNSVSVGICLIGDWTGSLPPSQQLKAAKDLIRVGLELGYVQWDYKLVGHRQVRDTDCPGDELFREIKRWPHYSEYY